MTGQVNWFSDDGIRMLAFPGQGRLWLIDHHGTGGRSSLSYAIKRNLATPRNRRLEVSLQPVYEFFPRDGLYGSNFKCCQQASAHFQPRQLDVILGDLAPSDNDR